MDTEDLPLVADYADLLQLGARNCRILPAARLGKLGKPVLLKRGPPQPSKNGSWPRSTSSPMALPGRAVERGIRTFETMTRNTLDLNAVPVLKSLTTCPSSWIPATALACAATSRHGRAAIAAGADGLIIEVHPHPDQALSDGHQSLSLPEFADLMPRCESSPAPSDGRSSLGSALDKSPAAAPGRNGARANDCQAILAKMATKAMSSRKLW